MGKTKKRQNKKAARVEARLAVNAPTPMMAAGKKSATSVGKIARAADANLCREACIALDALLAECERGEREDAAPLSLCSKVLAMCQREKKGNSAMRLLGRMEAVGLPIGPVQLRQVFFACCGAGMIAEALALMSRRDDETGARVLGKDVLVRGCGIVPGGPDGDAGMRLLEGTLRGCAGGGWEVAPVTAIDAVRVYRHPPWAPPRTEAREREEEDEEEEDEARKRMRMTAGGAAAARDVSAEADALAATLYPPGEDGEDGSFWFVCDDDGRRRPADRDALELYAPATPGTIPLDPPGLESESFRSDVPRVPGAFCVTNVFSERECAALRAAAHAIGWRRDAPDPSESGDGGLNGRLDHCELVIWPETAARIWDRIKIHAPPGAVGVNARFRFFRYGVDTIYRRHVDGSWPQAALMPEGEYVTDASEGRVRSRLTLLIYLSDGFGGGETTFYNADGCAPGTIAAAGVSPTEGGCLCFPHGDAEDSPVHEGSPVNAGLKYIIRTDVLFDKESKKADPTQGTALAEGKE